MGAHQLQQYVVWSRHNEVMHAHTINEQYYESSLQGLLYTYKCHVHETLLGLHVLDAHSLIWTVTSCTAQYHCHQLSREYRDYDIAVAILDEEPSLGEFAATSHFIMAARHNRSSDR